MQSIRENIHRYSSRGLRMLCADVLCAKGFKEFVIEDIIFPERDHAHERASRDWVAAILRKGPIKMGTLLNRGGQKNRAILREVICHMVNDGSVIFENFRELYR